MKKERPSSESDDANGAEPASGDFDRDAILDFVRVSRSPLDARDIIRAFGLGSAMRRPLMQMLRELVAAGKIGEVSGHRFVARESEPEIAVFEVVRLGRGGDLHATMATGPHAGKEIRLMTGRHAPSVGDRVLCRLRASDRRNPVAEVLRVLPKTPQRIVGIFAGDARGGTLQPVDRRLKHSPAVRASDLGGAVTGELVLAELAGDPALAMPRYRIIERLGRPDAAKAVSLIALHQHGVPFTFSAAAVAEARAARPAALDGRADLRALSLVTIDGADARDFDDAVFAAADTSADNAGGWTIVVAIADVAHYVQPGGALDLTALERGNSVYFPDRVVPMLPEELSNELCSLKPAEDRACLAAHLTIDAEGALLEQRFERGLMRSVARLTYEQVQRAQDGAPDAVTQPLLEPVLRPLYGAFRVLDAARRRRQTIELDLPERKIAFDQEGRVCGVHPQTRLDSHRLIEELMILANVAAAETLDAQRRPCLYRIHEAPDQAKLAALRPVLRELGIAVPPSGFGAADFNRILRQVRGTPHERLVNDMVLRTQAQARYSPVNRGHFGLGLRHYAHFTSPIRRYSDLAVHRSLLGEYSAGEARQRHDVDWNSIADQVSTAERRGMAAEREAFSRYVAAFLADRVGAEFGATISGVARFGLFISLSETGAEGLIPMARLAQDYYRHDPERHCLVGQATRKIFRLGDPVTVRLAEIETATASLSFDLIGHTSPFKPPQRAAKAQKHQRRRTR